MEKRCRAAQRCIAIGGNRGHRFGGIGLDFRHRGEIAGVHRLRLIQLPSLGRLHGLRGRHLRPQMPECQDADGHAAAYEKAGNREDAGPGKQQGEHGQPPPGDTGSGGGAVIRLE